MTNAQLCAICGLEAGPDATSHLTDDIEILSPLSEGLAAAAGVMATCAPCTSWLPRWRDPLPAHLARALEGRMSLALRSADAARELQAEAHRWARQIARALYMSARGLRPAEAQEDAE